MQEIEQIKGGAWTKAPTGALKNIKAQLNLDERQLLFHLLAQGYEGAGAVVDAGAFLGGSARCMALGLRANRRVPEERKRHAIHSYDLFAAGKWMADKWFPQGRPADGADTRPLYEANLADLLPYVAIHQGDITSARWEGGPIELLFLDICTTIETNDHCTRMFFPHLIPGRSILIQKAYLHRSPNIWIYGTLELLRDHFERIAACRVNSVAYLCTKPVTETDAVCALMKPLTPGRRAELASAAAERWTGEARRCLEGSVDAYLENPERYAGRREPVPHLLNGEGDPHNRASYDRLDEASVPILRRDWERESTPRLEPIKAQLSLAERQLLLHIMRDYFRGDGQVIDAGALAGGSALCMALGLEANTAIPERARLAIIHSFDRFRAGRWMIDSRLPDGRHVFSDGLPPAGTSTRPIFERNLGDYLRYVTVHEGEIEHERWDRRPIEVLFLDICKSVATNDHCTEIFFPCLIPGRSLLIQQDYLLKSWNIWMYVTLELLADHFTLLTACPYNSAVYLCTKEITAQDAAQARVAPLTHEQRLALTVAAAKRWNDSGRVFLDASAQIYLDALTEGVEMVSSVD